MVAAYNPTLYLVESHVASYKIYVLKNPFNGDVFYVGQTMQTLAERLVGHLSCTGNNRDKINYIREILEKGEKPVIEDVESIHAKCYIDKVLVHERENYWINHYRGIGCKLLNLAMPQAHEYKHYLSCIKRGEVNWRYYYCGRTVSGIEVYDEKKLLADGFQLPTYRKPYSEENNNEHYYNPWENERFIKSIGYRTRYDDHLSYVPCYNDMNPKFYDDDY